MDHIEVMSPLASFVRKEKTAVLWLNAGDDQEQSAIKKRLWNDGTFRVCVDGAANFLEKLLRRDECVKPNLITGDFDSIEGNTKCYFESQNVPLIETPDQDYTDMCKALAIIADEIDRKHSDVIVVNVLGGIGDRFDHTLSSLSSLLRFRKQSKCPIVMIDQRNMVTIIKEGTTELRFDNVRHLLTGKCGVVPIMQQKTVASTSGLKWNLADSTLAFGSLVSTSNEIVDDCVNIKCTTPIIFTAQLTEKAVE